MQFYKAGWALLGTMVVAGCGGGISVPPAQTDAATIEQQAQSFIETMKPRRPGKPIVVVLAVNEGTEMTDFLLPHAVLQRSGVVDVHAVAAQRGVVHLYPALDVEVSEDLASFDQANPAGADYVIVPAMSNENHPAITGWLQQQAQKGARIIGVCVGALVVANAGLLDGRRFVTHWYSREKLLEQHPTAVYVPHQRFLVDRDVATTTGITASVPMLISLVEAIGGVARGGAGCGIMESSARQLEIRAERAASLELHSQQSGFLAAGAMERRCEGGHG